MSPSPTLPTPPTVPSDTVPSDTVRRPLSPRSTLRDLHSRGIPLNAASIRFMGPRPSPPSISREMKEMMDCPRSSIRRPISTLNDPFFSILERAERRGEDRSPHRIDLSSRFDRPFFSSERVERRRDENNMDEEYNKLMEAIRSAKEGKKEKDEKDENEEIEENEEKEEKGEKAVDGVIRPVNERSPSPIEIEATKEEKHSIIANGEEKPVSRTRTSIKSTKKLGPDGSLQLVFARCEKTIEENGKVITHEKEEHHFTQ